MAAREIVVLLERVQLPLATPDLNMRYFLKILVICTLMPYLSGCGTGACFKKITSGLKKDVVIEAPTPKLRVGEKFIYRASWMGISVGTASLEVKELTKINGHEVYHIVARAKSNAFLSAIFKVDDEIHSYIDKDGLFSWRLERKMREGRYKADETMDFNQDKHVATYHSLRNGSVKTVEIPKETQDEISCFYFFRTQDAKVGESVFIDVNSDEKNWIVEVKVLEKGLLKVGRLGTFNAFLAEPHATFRFKNTPLKEGKMQIWFSADKERIPLMVKIKAPIAGSVSAVLKQKQ